MFTTLALLALAPQQARPAQQLDLGSFAYDPAVVSTDDLSVVLWKDGGTSELFASAANGRAVNWSAPVRVDDDLTGAAKYMHDRCLAIADGVAYAVWRDARNGDTDVYLARSTDGGASWSAAQRLDDGHAPGAESVDDVQIVASGSHVYVAMRVDNPGGGEDIAMASSMDGGLTWNPTLVANSVTADCDYFTITCEGTNAFVAWADGRDASGMDDLYLRMTHNGGVSWMMSMLDEQIDQSGPAVGDVEAPEILSAGGMTGYVVAWLEDESPTSASDEELHFLYSPDGGHMWPFPEVVIGSGTDVENPALGFDGATIVLAWEDDRSGSDEVYAAVSRDFGLSWTEHQISSGGGAYPVVRGGGDHWAVAYAKGGFPEQTGLAMSRDGGMTFLPALDLEQGAGADSDYVELAFNKRYGNFVSAWLDDATGSNHVYVGGARPQSLEFVSPSMTPGDALHFEARHFPASDDGAHFAVVVATGLGSLSLPYGDGRDTGLLNNPYYPHYRSLLTGSLDASGYGSTPPGVVPNTPGVTYYAAAVSYLQSQTGTYLLSLTDVTAQTVN